MNGMNMKSKPYLIRMKYQTLVNRCNHEYEMFERDSKSGNYPDAYIHYGAYRILLIIIASKGRIE